MRPRTICLLVAPMLVVASYLVPMQAKKKGAELQIGPGPPGITADERSIEEDPAAGIERAMILVEETERNENLPTAMETRFHRRVKILSNEGRDLANVEIPFDPKSDKLKEWWGRTILPDGKVLELARSRLEQQTAVETGGRRVDVLKAAFPGVVPGCVIDYGYVLREEGYYPYDRVLLQREWPVREFRFLWKPTLFFQGAYFLIGTEELDVKADISEQSILITGRNLPPVKEEPLMPPIHTVRASALLYYILPGTEFESYWNDVSEILDRLVATSVKKKKSVQEALATMALPVEGGAMGRVRAAYDWMNANIKRSGLKTFEEIEQASHDDDKFRDPVPEVLKTGEGNTLQVQLFFVAVARTLGADADLVWVADRRDTLFNPNLKTFRQFDSTMVAVRPRGATDDQIVVADPCSGLEFGEIPWWYTGVHGMLATKEGGRPIPLAPSRVDSNVSKAKVRMSFTEDNESLIVNWSHVGSGQIGLDERRYLRRLSPDERAERIDELCGGSPDVDVLTAEVAGLEELNRNLEMSCETETFDVDLEDNVYRVQITGPWVSEIPDLSEEEREHPIVFDFPRADIAEIAVGAPEGFAPDDPPSPVELESELGKYVLRIEKGDGGFKVHRELRIYPLTVPLNRYAHLRELIETIRLYDRRPLKFSREE